MTQEKKNLLLKDICARLPYGVNVLVSSAHGTDPIRKKLNTNLLFGLQKSVLTIKPYLRLMSNMTDDEEKEFALLQTDFYVDGILYPIAAINMVNWLNSHHFDYCGLIEKGLALEAPDGMYKTE